LRDKTFLGKKQVLHRNKIINGEEREGEEWMEKEFNLINLSQEKRDMKIF
jgi:hypothetical protein